MMKRLDDDELGFARSRELRGFYRGIRKNGLFEKQEPIFFSLDHDLALAWPPNPGAGARVRNTFS
jgi:hypothetical protein